MVLTTTDSIPDRKIKNILGMVTGTDIYLVGGVFGGGLVDQETLFSDAFTTASVRMQVKAHSLGADAVIGIKSNFTSPGNVNYMILVLTGTAVELELTEEEKQQLEEKKKREEEEQNSLLQRLKSEFNDEISENLNELYSNNLLVRKDIILSVCKTFKSDFSLKDVFNKFDEIIPMLDLGACLKALVEEQKLIMNSETYEYSVKVESQEEIIAREKQKELMDRILVDGGVDINNYKDLIDLYNNNPIHRKKIVMGVCKTFDSSFTLRDVYNAFNEEIPLMEIGAYLKALVDEQKLVMNGETSKYNVV